MATVFEEMRNGSHYDIRDAKYQEEVHSEIDRCRHICWEINNIDPNDREELKAKEHKLIADMQEGAFLTPPIQIDCANCVHLGKNVFANHGLTVMSVGYCDHRRRCDDGSGSRIVHRQPRAPEYPQHLHRRDNHQKERMDWSPRKHYAGSYHR